METISIVGASLAGTQAAQGLRRAGFDGSIVIIGAETHLPYDRPPLSKKFLGGSTEREALTLRPAIDPDTLNADWRLGTKAVGLELGDQGGTVRLDSGSGVEFDGLVIATGANARSLAGHENTHGVHRLRGLDDAISLKAALDNKPQRVVVIGCGFIGTEVAATARELGLEVTLIDTAPAPLSRVLDYEAGMALAKLHRDHGVDVRLGVGISELVTADHNGTPKVVGVSLSDDTTIDTTVVVVGIGVTVSTEWIESSPLTLDDGVVVDEYCFAAPRVVAAGDVARWKHLRYQGQLTRVEQWDNAVEMGAHAAKNLLASHRGEPLVRFNPVPWFWSDQYDRKIHLAGITSENTEMIQGDRSEGVFVQAYMDQSGAPVGVLCWNRPRQAIMGRRLLDEGVSIDQLRSELG